ncbi:alpha/beta fold hydrolase [Legionella bononiensis]|uniref:Alpha/beta hydrolase n=1 Tax=Legionella bononiensis TaxID=2793102 RepID=A0ABS1WDY8_9GAMM|nr:alpha/beta hydrolase [Legionella bononiensis]MBL7479554.1 alpha/beta hydrolase [Legionella bononiensis]MBL7527572.1 alpha/beta hydrolase [Legionella bononiensis]
MNKIFDIKVPSRINAPETTIHIQIVYEHEEALKTKPYVFMIPGGPGANHSNYKDYECIQEEANVIFYDPRGCGLSAKGEPSTYTLDNNIDDIHYIIGELKLEQVIMLGKSCGAITALGFTVRYPEQVSSLILAAGAPSYAFLETAKANVLAKGTEEQIKVCETLWSGSFINQEETDHYFEVMKPFYSWKIRHNEPVSRPAPIYPYSFDALNEGFRSNIWKFNYLDKLSDITCTTLVLVGEEDWITSPVYSIQMANAIPNSSLKIFEKSDHSMESDVPERFFGAIREFIKVNELVHDFSLQHEPLESSEEEEEESSFRFTF